LPMNVIAYHAYQAFAEWLRPLRAGASVARATMLAWPSLAASPYGRYADACFELLDATGLSHQRPPFGIASVEVDGRLVAVKEEVVKRTPFGSLLRFAKDCDALQSRVLIVAPMSGHFATLLRGTVRTMLADHG